MTIVCAVDTSRRAARVADTARRLASAVDAPVVLAHVFDPWSVPAPATRELRLLMPSEAIEEQWRARARRGLARVADPHGSVAETTVLAEGRPDAEILRLLKEHEARILVIGSAVPRPLERIMRGSTSADVARQAPCPVMVVTDDGALPDSGPVLAGYDGSDHSLRAARSAAMLAASMRRDLVLVHVKAEGQPMMRADAHLASELHDAARSCEAAAAGLEVKRLDVVVAAEEGDPVERLIQAARARGAALIVLGHRGRNALAAAVLGSVAAGVIRWADRPVVVCGPHADGTPPGARRRQPDPSLGS